MINLNTQEERELWKQALVAVIRFTGYSDRAPAVADAAVEALRVRVPQGSVTVDMTNLLDAGTRTMRVKEGL